MCLATSGPAPWMIRFQLRLAQGVLCAVLGLLLSDWSGPSLQQCRSQPYVFLISSPHLPRSNIWRRSNSKHDGGRLLENCSRAAKPHVPEGLLSAVLCISGVLAGMSCRRSLRSHSTSKIARRGTHSVKAFMRRYGRLYQKKKKKPRATGPKMMKSGYWQEDLDAENEIDIFEWISPDELTDVESSSEVKNVREVAAFTRYPRCNPEVYDAPEYRAPPRNLQLSKSLKSPPALDQGRDASFVAEMSEQIANFGVDGYSFEGVDIVTSLPALKILLAFVDGTLAEDMRAKGVNTRMRGEAVQLDLLRIGRLAEAPDAITMGTVWNWLPEDANSNGANFNRRSYDVDFEQIVSGKETFRGPPSIRELNTPTHYRILEYKLGELKVVVRVPFVCSMPAVDADAVDNPWMAVECSTANRRDAGKLWGHTLSTKLAEMQVGNTGMLARAVVDKGWMVELQELTQEDLLLDRPSLEEETGALLGKLEEVLSRVRDVASCPGAVDRALYLQYCDAELRIIAPVLDEDLERLADKRISDDEVAEVLGMTPLHSSS
eukprot:TRINITY_DN64530_c0_g1_i1.p1 TRINITY_DN64530_c0_g1~~TRINITY_DN64530_c0_g1_i1.p1  ORF type:complete len:547 (-),score=88.19 TRINITY_DN64530_c0_g1_i1:106-1746(-)